MIQIAGESGLAIPAAAVATRWVANAWLLLSVLLLCLWLRERSLRRLDRREDSLRRTREMSALGAMAATSSRTSDPGEILKNTANWTRELFAQHCDLLLLDRESGRVMRSETTRENRDDQECEELHRIFDGGLTGAMVQAGGEIVTEQDLPRLPEPAQAWIARRGYGSFVAVVLYSHGKAMGILFLTSPKKKPFDASDRNLALTIARQLGTSLEKVRVHAETALAYDNLRHAQEQILHNEKMSAVGQFIAGVAHELNNPLTAILGYLQLLDAEPLGEQAKDYVRKLYGQAQRTHRVVQNLLSFSRQRKPSQSLVDMRRLLQESLALRASDLERNSIQVEFHSDSAVPLIPGAAHQLEQVFLNIINNAVDSIMDLGEGGSLKVRIYPEGPRVCVEFRDSGTGLADPGKIFDPFYTTKKIGKGSGLGLSICYGIVREHGGKYHRLQSQAGGRGGSTQIPGCQHAERVWSLTVALNLSSEPVKNTYLISSGQRWSAYNCVFRTHYKHQYTTILTADAS
jgi:signal transduction histidine kinase